MIRSTFRLTSGIGPFAEGQLWKAGFRCWSDLPPPPERIVSPRVDPRLRDAVARASAACAARDAASLASMIPRAEQWRLFAEFAEEAAYLDIETDGGDTVTVVGILDVHGPRAFVAGRDLDAFPEAAARWKVLVTFNGASFDVPMLRRRFRGWRPPPAHVDLRHLWHRLGHRGGLKLLERAQGIVRSPELEGVDGLAAIGLWQRHLDGDDEALRLLVDYNLRDTVNLRPLMERGYNRLVARLGAGVEPVRESTFGDVAYDVTKALLALR